jgi:hypothetical protein
MRYPPDYQILKDAQKASFSTLLLEKEDRGSLMLSSVPSPAVLGHLGHLYLTR